MAHVRNASSSRYVYANLDELYRWLSRESPSRAPVHIATESEDLRAIYDKLCLLTDAGASYHGRLLRLRESFGHSPILRTSALFMVYMLTIVRHSATSA
jgi:hypothetical protein